MNTGIKIERPVRKIEPLQIRMIHTAVATLGLSDDVYRDILWMQYKASSCTDLTYFQASRLIDHFKALGFKIPKRKKYTKGTSAIQDHLPPRRDMPPNVFVLPTRDQLDMIDALAGQIIWKLEDGFQRWLAKYIKVSRVTTAVQASRAIEGLKGMLANQQRTVNGE